MGEIMSVSKEGRFPQAKHNPNEPLYMSGFYSIAAGMLFFQFPHYTEPYHAWSLIGLGIGAIGVDFYNKLFRKEQELIKAMGLKNSLNEIPALIRKQVVDNGTNYVYSLPKGMSVGDFKAKKEVFENYHRVKNVEIGYNGGQIIVKTIEKEVEKFIPYEFQECDLLDILVGKSMKMIEFLNIGDENPHVLFAGESGGGKTVALRVVITNLILNAERLQSKVKLQLYLIDLKYGVEFQVFAKSKYVHAFITEVEEVDRLMIILNTEMKKRYKKFYEKEVNNIEDYNKKCNNEMDYKIVIFDEFSTLEKEKEIKERVQSLTTLARACGIHILVCTQRPDAKILEGIIKSNVKATIGMKTRNYTNSRIIIEDENVRLDKLRGKGHCIVQGSIKGSDKQIVECQQMFLSLDDVKKLIKHTYVEKDLFKDNEQEEDKLVQLKKNNKKTKYKPKRKNSGEINVEDIEL